MEKKVELEQGIVLKTIDYQENSKIIYLLANKGIAQTFVMSQLLSKIIMIRVPAVHSVLENAREGNTSISNSFLFRVLIFQIGHIKHSH